MMKKNQINKFFQNLFLLFVLIFLFIFANPNFLINKGFGFVAWFYYIPLLFLIHKCSYKSVWLAGGIFGFLFYAGYAYWLINYGTICFIFICTFYAIEYSFLFLLLKYCDKKDISYNWLLFFIVISAFEYLKTKGFLGFNYGVTAYTQWQYVSLIQICDVLGVFGLNSLIIFFNCLMFNICLKVISKKQYKHHQETDLEINQFDTHLNYLKENKKIMKQYSTVNNFIVLGIFTVGLVISLILENKNRDFGVIGNIKIAAIQHNEDPDKEGVDFDIQNFKTLYELTDTALEMDEDIKIVVWPETAIVPSINYKYFRLNNGPIPDKNEEKSINLVINVLNYINKKNQVFVIGNNGITLNQNYNPESLKFSGEPFTYSNDALVFESKKNVIPPEPKIYSKIKLVPFTEGFPYSNILPEFNNKLIELFDYLYTPGCEYTSFNYGSFFFSTPICFEDTFSEVGRQMYKSGSRCFINITNDSWSKSAACQYQHLAMAVFRSVENRIPSVRSATSGVSCAISERGRVIKQGDLFDETFVIAEIPVISRNRKPTFYCKNGYYIEYGFIVFTIVLLLIQIFIDIIKKTKGKHNGKKR